MPIKKNETKVLRALCRNARRTLEDIGNETGLTGPGVGKIIDRLETGGVITGYIALPALDKIGYNIISILLFRWDHSVGKVDDLKNSLTKTRGLIFAGPVQGPTYTHVVISAHTNFGELERFLTAFRTKWDGVIRDDSVLLMSPGNAMKDLDFDVF